jgi:tryptophan synthase beta subunit
MFAYDQPDASGHFGRYGGSFVSETLVHALDELKAAYAPWLALEISDSEDGWILMTAQCQG